MPEGKIPIDGSFSSWVDDSSESYMHSQYSKDDEDSEDAEGSEDIEHRDESNV